MCHSQNEAPRIAKTAEVTAMDAIDVATSGQSFTQLLFNSLLSGVIVTIVATSMASIAVTSAVFAILGASFWLWHMRSPAEPRADQA